MGGTRRRIRIEYSRCRGEAWQWDRCGLNVVDLAANRVSRYPPMPSRVIAQGWSRKISAADTCRHRQRRRSGFVATIWRAIAQHGVVVCSAIMALAASSSSSGLNAISPKLAIASSGFRNSYHHPTAAGKRVCAHGIKLYRTDAQGSVALFWIPLALLPRTVHGLVATQAVLNDR